MLKMVVTNEKSILEAKSTNVKSKHRKKERDRNRMIEREREREIQTDRHQV